MKTAGSSDVHGPASDSFGFEKLQTRPEPQLEH